MTKSGKINGLYYTIFNIIRNFSIDDEVREELEASKDFETVSKLTFPAESTSNLYNRINKQFLKIFVMNHSPIQTTCSMRNWEKLIKINSTNSTQSYYLTAAHTINKLERTIIVRSPLQVSYFFIANYCCTFQM